MSLKILGLQKAMLDFNRKDIKTYVCSNVDVKTRGLEVHVLNNGMAYNCTDVTLKLYVRTMNLDIYESISATTGSATGIYEVLFPEGMVGGVALGEIILENGTERIGSFPFGVIVIDSITSNGSISQAPGAGVFFDVINSEKERVAAEVARVTEFNEMIANGYIIPQSPVNTFADLATTYPNAVKGWSAKTLEDGKVYRYDGSVWHWIDTITASSYDALLTKFSSELAQNTNIVNEHTTQITALSNGAPKAVATIAEMIDTTKNYVYTGTENGYVAGNWYFYKNSAWVSGGVYQASAIGDRTVKESNLSIDVLDMLGGQKYVDITDTVTLINGGYNNNTGYYQSYGDFTGGLKMFASIEKIAIKPTDKIKVSAYISQTSNVSLAYFWDSNNNFISSIAPVVGNYEMVDITIPSNAAYVASSFRTDGTTVFKIYKYQYDIDVNKRVTDTENDIANIKNDNSDYKSNYDFNLYNWQNRIIEEQLKNDFAWKSFDKCYVTICVDDGLRDLNMVRDLFKTKEVPLCCAIPYERLAVATLDSSTVKNTALDVVNNGGEILVHSAAILTSSSAENDYYNMFIANKKSMAEAGFEINGIITAGGTGQDTADFKKCVRYMRPYYRYSDFYGYNQNTPQYYHPRTFANTSNLDALKSAIDTGIANKTWVAIGFHGFSGYGEWGDSSQAVIGGLIDYIISKGTSQVEILTYKNLFDKMGSSKLEQLIASL